MNDYFCGWYFKCQSKEKTLALIPAYHRKNGKKSCSLQVITDEGTWNVRFPWKAFQKKKKGLCVKLGESRFSEKEIRLNVHSRELHAVGKLAFGNFSEISYDIMGPFCLVPFLQCRHRVYSMRHTVKGRLTVNGSDYVFDPGVGYLESDRGRSFPREYAWTQCSFSEGSLMLSAADIPIGPFHFNGIISVVRWRGREYRLATYLGARLVKAENGELVIRQGDSCLRAKLKERNTKPLCAPVNGAMTRTIQECPSCRAAYSFERKGKILFRFVSERAAFEYEYPK